MGKSRACCGLTKQFGKEISAILLIRCEPDNDCIPAKGQSPTVSICCILTYMEHVQGDKDLT